MLILNIQYIFDLLIKFIEYFGYYNSIIVVIVLYISYYILSKTFTFIIFLFIGIIIGIYMSIYVKKLI
jgi:hypothetical protein